MASISFPTRPGVFEFLAPFERIRLIAIWKGFCRHVRSVIDLREVPNFGKGERW